MLKPGKAAKDVWLGLLFIVLGSVYFYLSYTQARGPSDWSLSPGFFPRMSAAFIIGLSLLLAVVSIFRTTEGRKPRDDAVQLKPYKYVIATILIIVIYILIMERLGYIPSTVIVLFAMMLLYGGRRWILLAVLAVAFPLFIYYFSLKVMYVLFPSGQLF